MSNEQVICPNPNCDWQGDATDAIPGVNGRLVCPECGTPVEHHDPDQSDR